MGMIQDTEPFPPPSDWTPVEISWDIMLDKPGMCHAVLAWCKQHPSQAHFQLRGSKPNPVNGYRFYFEDARDATAFALRWLQ